MKSSGPERLHAGLSYFRANSMTAPFIPVQRCPVASEKFAGGEYFAHQGDPDSFLVVDVAVKDGSARVQLVLWRCVYCGVMCAGIGLPGADLEFSWVEESVTLIGG